MSEEKKSFDLKYLFTGDGIQDWWKALGYTWRIGVIVIIIVLFIAGGMAIWRFFNPAKSQNVNKPVAIALGKVEKGAIDQTSTQVMIEKEKAWEVGIGGGGIYYDEKTGVFGGGWIRKRF
jgi:hypothetical protein